MPLDEPGKSPSSDPVLNLLDVALHDGAVVIDAYARFAAAMIGTLLFPYAATRPATSTQRQSESERPPKSRHPGIMKVLVALIIGAVLGRRLFPRS
jgi:hypothetical protein